MQQPSPNAALISRIKDPEIQHIFSTLDRIPDDNDKFDKLKSLASDLISTSSTGDGQAVSAAAPPNAAAPPKGQQLPPAGQVESRPNTWEDLCSFACEREKKARKNTNVVDIYSMPADSRTFLAYYRRGAAVTPGGEFKTIEEVFEQAKDKKADLHYLSEDNGISFRYNPTPSLEAFASKVAPIYADKKQAISSALNGLLANVDNNGKENYIADLLCTQPENFDFRDAVFANQVPIDKSSVLLVAGLSGSGKTWLPVFGLPKLCQESAFLYCTVPDNVEDRMKDRMSEDDDVDVPPWISRAMSTLFTMITKGDPSDDDYTPLYRRVSQSSMEINERRNSRAQKVLLDLCRERIDGNADLVNWWEGRGPTLTHLVVVVDECGKSLHFTRGIIDTCRDIAGTLCATGSASGTDSDQRTATVLARAERAKIVLVGTRLDTWSASLDQRRDHGTDPSKFEVVHMVRPDLRKLPDRISADELGGWYSKILAGNTRILMRALIPTLCVPALTDHYYDHGGKTGADHRREDRVKMGSQNALMKYGARLYCVLNGVSDLKSNPQKRYDFFSKLFSLFLTRSLDQRSRKAFFVNQAKLVSMQQFRNELPIEDVTRILSNGLALEDPASEPNTAMEYLACHGEHFSQDVSDGLALEAALEMHLKKHYYSTCQEHPPVVTLEAAWAPPKDTETNKEASLSDTASPKKKKRKTSSKDASLSDAHWKDVEKISAVIINALNGPTKSRFHIILRQSVANAEGPNVMVLIVTADQLRLDLYQCKNYTDFKSKFREGWFHTVGLKLDNTAGTLELSPEGKPGYCEFFVSQLVNLVAAKVRVTQSAIGLRAVVVPQSAEDVLTACYNESTAKISAAGQLLTAVEKTAKSKKVEVALLTSDCLRPTIRVVKVKKGKGNDEEEG